MTVSSKALEGRRWSRNQMRPTYTYDSKGGRLLTRVWARGITTTYGYNGADALRTIQYSNGTSGVTLAYDGNGQIAGVTDGAGSRSLTYTSDGQLQSETFPEGGRLEYSFNAGRKAGYAYWDGAAWVTWGGWGYDPVTGRISGVSTPDGWAAYGYRAGTSWQETLTYRATTSTRTPDGIWRLKTIETKDSSGTVPHPLLKHTYTYNAAGQRIKGEQGDGAYWTYGYNTKGEVTSGSKRKASGTTIPGTSFTYQFDQIGNRNYTNMQGRAAGWTRNTLNQYTSRNYPSYGSSPSVDIMGEANAAAIVTVNGQSTTRDGKFFHKSIAGTGSMYVGTWTLAQIVENNPSAPSTSATGSAWIEPGMTTFTYDLDGNLTQDDRWTYTWDGENRLIQMETKATDVPANLPRQKLVFRYDHRSRRTEKEVWLKNGSGTYVKQKHWKFTYDGWNLIAERDTMTTSVQRTYQWGTDLSGTLQGAGGVGGLLAITSSASGNTSLGRYCYDGNGNITGIVDASLTPGNFATYEYGPFGEPLRFTGAMAQTNPFRFSTKYQDNETGLAYYGYRYYQPTTGRWLNRDPSQESGGVNLYAFALNNPVTSYDFLGLYTSEEVRQRLVEKHGAKLGFVLKEMDTKGYDFKIENLWGRRFDGTRKGAYIDCEANNLNQAAEWGLNALREWAYHGNESYTQTLARDWANRGAEATDVPTALGTTLDLLHLLSGESSGSANGQMLTASEVEQIYCWAFANTRVAGRYPARAIAARSSVQGLNPVFWDSAGGVQNTSDQTHHFAGYFEMGGRVGSSNAVIFTALRWTGDVTWNGTIVNQGDVSLGILGARWGSRYINSPSYYGRQIEADLRNGTGY